MFCFFDFMHSLTPSGYKNPGRGKAGFLGRECTIGEYNNVDAGDPLSASSFVGFLSLASQCIQVAVGRERPGRPKQLYPTLDGPGLQLHLSR